MAQWQTALVMTLTVVVGAGCGGSNPVTPPVPPAREWLQEAPSAVEAVLLSLDEANDLSALFVDQGDGPVETLLLIDGKPPPDDLIQRLRSRKLRALWYTAAQGRQADIELETIAGGGTSSVTIRVSDGIRRRLHDSPPDPGVVYSATEVEPGKWKVVRPSR